MKRGGRFVSNLRFHLYRSLRQQCEKWYQSADKELDFYKQDYEKEIRRPWRLSSLNDLLSQIKQADILLLGDFHALQQSQKAHLRLLRLLPAKTPKILFVECISAQDQECLDLYQQGQITEEKFLSDTRWQERWGFSWRSYRPLFRWAKKKNVPIVAIDKDLKKHGETSLKIRDQFSAQVIVDKLKNSPASTLGIVIMGDYHISQGHLPKEIKQLWPEAKIARVFQNSEPIYFKLSQKFKDLDTDVIRFSSWDFGIVSVAPWVKWYSLLNHLQEQDEDLSPDERIYEDLIKFFRLLKQDWQLILDEDFEVVTLNDSSFFDQLETDLGPNELRDVSYLVTQGMHIYFPQYKKLFLAKTTLNHMAEAAAVVCLYKCSQSSWWLPTQREYLIQLIWLQIVAYVGSKFINPKRKTDTIYDIKSRLKKKKDPALLWTLKLYQQGEWWAVTGKARLAFFKQVPKKQRFAVAQLLGYFLGEKIYYGIAKKYLALEDFIELLKLPFEQWSDAYFKICAWESTIPDPYRSKRLKV